MCLTLLLYLYTGITCEAGKTPVGPMEDGRQQLVLICNGETAQTIINPPLTDPACFCRILHSSGKFVHIQNELGFSPGEY